MKTTLDGMRMGQTGTVSKVNGEGVLRCRLLDMGLIPKTKVKVIKFAPLGDPMEISLRGYDLTIRKGDASLVGVVV